MPLQVNDKKFDDFDSPLWQQAGLEKVREDLLEYYLINRKHIAAQSYHASDSIKFDSVRSSFPNNCLSYALGIITEGNESLWTCNLHDLNFISPKTQYREIDNEQISQAHKATYESSQLFENCLTLADIHRITYVDKKDMHKRIPIIGLTQNGNDRHFFRLSIQIEENTPRVYVSHKESANNGIYSHMTFDRWIHLYQENDLECCYTDPHLYLCPSELQNRKVIIERAANSTLFHLSATPTLML